MAQAAATSMSAHSQSFSPATAIAARQKRSAQLFRSFNMSDVLIDFVEPLEDHLAGCDQASPRLLASPQACTSERNLLMGGGLRSPMHQPMLLASVSAAQHTGASVVEDAVDPACHNSSHVSRASTPDPSTDKQLALHGLHSVNTGKTAQHGDAVQASPTMSMLYSPRGGSPAAWKTIPAHTYILQIGSDVLAAQLERWRADSNATHSHSGRSTPAHALQMHVSQEEEASVLAMVHFWYADEFPSALTPLQLVQVLRLADQYGAGACMIAAAAAIHDLKSSETQNQELVHALLQLPESLQQQPATQHALEAALDRFTSPFGDLEVAFSKQGMLDAFAALPYKAVQHILASPETKVASENTALLALACWVKVQRTQSAGQSPTEQQLDVLVPLIKHICLSASYILAVASRLPWYWRRAQADPERALEQYSSMARRDACGAIAQSIANSAMTILCSRHTQARRKMSSLLHGSLDWNFRDISSLYITSSGPSTTFCGFTWSLGFVPVATAASPGLLTTVKAGVCLTVSLHPLIDELQPAVKNRIETVFNWTYNREQRVSTSSDLYWSASETADNNLEIDSGLPLPTAGDHDNITFSAASGLAVATFPQMKCCTCLINKLLL